MLKQETSRIRDGGPSCCFSTAGIRARGDRLSVIVGVESFYELLLTSRSL